MTSLTLERLLIGIVVVSGVGLMVATAALTATAGGDVYDRALSLYNEGKYGEAATAFEEATKESPEDARAFAYLGLSRLHSGQRDRALEPLRRAVALNEDLPEAHFGLGLSHAHAGRVDEAVAALERAIHLNPRLAYAHYHLGLAYNERGEVDKALLHLQRFVDLEPEAPEAAAVKSLLARLR